MPRYSRNSLNSFASSQLSVREVADWAAGGTLAKVSTNPGEAIALDSGKMIDGKPSLKITLAASTTFQCEFTLTKPISLGGFNSFDLPVWLPYDHGQMIGSSIIQRSAFCANGGQASPRRQLRTVWRVTPMALASFPSDMPSCC